MTTQPTTIMDMIPSGYENRIGRMLLIKKCLNFGIIPDSASDKERMLRMLINEARTSGAIICNDDGYFIPEGPEDVKYLDEYIRKNESKAKAIYATLINAKKLREDYLKGRL